MKMIGILVTLSVIIGCQSSQKSPIVIEWKAPESSNSVINPLKDNAAATEEGKKIFTKYCVVCHGDKGKGDGPAGMGLIPKPGNFTVDKTQKQTDGALYWKMSEGRAPMASYKADLTATQRWQLVNYLRTFKK